MPTSTPAISPDLLNQLANAPHDAVPAIKFENKWLTRCGTCGAPLVFDFKPIRPKLCDTCYRRVHSTFGLVGHVGTLHDHGPAPSWDNCVRALEEDR